MKQLGIAMQNYHDVHKALPTGNFSCCWGTWQMAVLPFIEEQQLADMYTWLPKTFPHIDYAYAYDSDQTMTGTSVKNRNKEFIMHRIATLTCPSDEPQTISDNTIGLVAGSTYHNYVANYGNTNHVGSSCLASTCVKYAGSPFIGTDVDPPVPIMVPFKKIIDGLSKTLMFSETVQGHDNDLRGYTWWGWSAGFETTATPNSNDLDLLQQAQYCVSVLPNPPCGAASGSSFRAAARSRHPGGVNVVMCDSSIQFVVDDVDLATWRAASTTRGNEVYSGLIP
jgi:prepilin-type processing-associated H-X9-DG protein